VSDLVSLKKKIDSATQLKFVVRTMKAVAASKINQYEAAVEALANYKRSVQMGLSVCFRETIVVPPNPVTTKHASLIAIVFGSDQGLVGSFNEIVATICRETLAKLDGDKAIWVVGERMGGRLTEDGLAQMENFPLPSSIDGITRLVGKIQEKMEAASNAGTSSFYIFHAMPLGGAQYKPVGQQLLPLDKDFRARLSKIPWPNKAQPELFGPSESMIKALVREYLFLSLFKACADSLASENACRLAAMQRAEKNIDSLMTDLSQNFHRIRQSSIDEELFDVISGFNALNKKIGV
jgi:F-type H+-transporting ATPase subunit gamma